MMKSLENEDEVIALAKSGDNLAFEQLSVHYLALIRKISTEYKAEGYDTNDFIQEGLLGLWNAVRSFDSKRQTAFRNYAMTCIKNRYLSIVRKSTGKTAIPDEITVPIDDIEITDKSLNPESRMLFRESLASFYDSVRNKLSTSERSVMELYIQGYSYKEISDKLKIPRKSVDNAIFRAKAKLADYTDPQLNN